LDVDGRVGTGKCWAMYAACVLIGPAVLRSLYVDQLRTADEIAKHFRCSGTTVLRHLRRFRIPARRRGPCVQRVGLRNGAVSLEWSANLAYVVGLIATDGNLGRKRPVITLVSKDVDLLETVRRCLGLTTHLRKHRGGYGQHWQDRRLYEWLREIGLSPAKSLTLPPLAVPDRYFPDFFRGCIDGDGSVLVYTDRYRVRKCERYIYERLYVSIVPASCAFIEWLRTTVHRLTSVNGSISVRQRPGTPAPLEASLRKGTIDSSAQVDVLRARRSVSGSKTSKAGEVLAPAGFSTVGTNRTSKGWMAIQCQSRAEGRSECHAGVM